MIEMLYGGEKHILYWDRLEQPRQDKEEPNEPSKEGPLSFVLFESPFAQFHQSAGRAPLSSLSGGAPTRVHG